MKYALLQPPTTTYYNINPYTVKINMLYLIKKIVATDYKQYY